MQKLIFFLLLICFSNAKDCQLWYQDSNHGIMGYLSKEEIGKFYRTKEWEKTLKVMDVYTLRIVSIFLKRNRINNSDIKKIIEVLNKYHIKLNLNAIGATLSGYSNRRKKMRRREYLAIDKLIKYGANINMILFQSVFDKNKIHGVRFKHNSYSDENRIRDIVEYATYIHSRYPNIKFGLIDALPVEGRDYKLPYRKLLNTMKSRGLSLDMIMLDGPYGMIKKNFRGFSWQKISNVEKYVKDVLHIKFGKIFTDNKSGRSIAVNADKRFFLNTKKMLNEFNRLGLKADACLFTSWYPVPREGIPESQMYTMTYDFLHIFKTKEDNK